MQSRRSTLVNLLLIVAVALSSLLVNVPVGTENRAPNSLAPLANSAVAAKGKHQDHGDRKRANRKHDRRSSRHNNDGNVATDQPAPSAREGDWQQYCDDEKLIRLNQNELCTHGSDSAAQFDLDKDNDNDTKVSSAAAQETAEVSCDGDGDSGFRVQALYVRGTSGPPLSDGLKAEIRLYLAQADQIFQQSATETGGVRNI